ncbi:TLR4 interactor with leucine rich repeats [Papilio xuthus]|uniref:TLR4 interactor with leucine rich repeats n=1 Tax=Papilio xuthus TaxID=66420 RepID=A0A0N0P9Y1_PAPXU|nr:TLR4 interactor with leucine rich repeats [Papilio xuthus]
MHFRVLALAVWCALINIIDSKVVCLYDDSLKTFKIRRLTCYSTLSHNVLRRDDLFKEGDYTAATIRRCQITQIDVDGLFNAKLVWDLNLSENKLKSLPLGVFDMNTHLEDLDLSQNLLTELPAGIFNRTKLRNLHLGGNNFKNFDTGLISYSPREMVSLDLTCNSLIGKNLNYDILCDMAILDLSGNDMNEITFMGNVKSLQYLHMKQCSLKNVPDFLSTVDLSKLLVLDLPYNEITGIGNATFHKLVLLKTLDLSNNRIEYIHRNAFVNLQILEKIKLNNNRLNYLSLGVFQNIPALNELDLSHNLLRDIHPNSFDNTTLKQLIISNNRITFLNPNQMSTMLSNVKSLKDIDFSENPWQCACLRDLLNELRNQLCQYNYYDYNGQNAVCVTTPEFICKRYEAANELFINMYDDLIAPHLTQKKLLFPDIIEIMEGAPRIPVPCRPRPSDE